VIYAPTPGSYSRTLGLKNYEQTNHLGNVLVTLTDRKLPFMDGGNFSCWNPDIQSITDYYLFGMMMPNRSYNSISESAGGSQTIIDQKNPIKESYAFWTHAGEGKADEINLNPLYYDRNAKKPFDEVLKNDPMQTGTTYGGEGPYGENEDAQGALIHEFGEDLGIHHDEYPQTGVSSNRRGQNSPTNAVLKKVMSPDNKEIKRL
jgi:hypothetical protein